MITCRHHTTSQNAIVLRLVLERHGLYNVDYTFNVGKDLDLIYSIDITEEEYLILKLKDSNFSNYDPILNSQS